MTIRCDSCASRLLETQEFCPKCGSPNADFRKRTKGGLILKTVLIALGVISLILLTAIKLLPLRVLYKMPGSIYTLKFRQTVFGDYRLAADTLDEYFGCWKAADINGMALYTQGSDTGFARGVQRYPVLPERYKILDLKVNGHISDAVVRVKTTDMAEVIATLSTMADPGRGNLEEAVKAAISGSERTDWYFSLRMSKENGRWTIPANGFMPVNQLIDSAVKYAGAGTGKHGTAELRVRRLRCNTDNRDIVKVTGLVENTGTGKPGPIMVSVSLLNETGNVSIKGNTLLMGPEPGSSVPFECFLQGSKMTVERYTVSTEVLLK